VVVHACYDMVIRRSLHCLSRDTVTRNMGVGQEASLPRRHVCGITPRVDSMGEAVLSCRGPENEE
jgi:hypothetical protein